MNRDGGRTGAGREVALAASFFLAATVLMTWPQATHLSNSMSDIWDAKLNARILQWDFRQTWRDPLHLFDLNFFHPATDVLAFSENLWGVSLFGFPLLAAGASPLLNYNVLLVAGMLFSALSAWALARYVTGDPLASAVAGFVYAFVPWRFAQIPHLQHQWGGFLCLFLLFLLRYLDHGRRRDAVLFGIAFGWNALCNVHFALFGGILAGVVLALAVLQGRGDRRRWRGALLAAFLGGLAFVPFAHAYLEASRIYGMKRYLSEILEFSGRWTDFLSAGPRNRLYGPLTARWRAPEGDFFPGVLPLALAAVAIGRGRGGPRREETAASPAVRRRRPAVRWLDGVMALLALVLVAAWAKPGLRVGPLHVGDRGRVLVLLTAALLVRLAIAFPAAAKRANLGDFVRHARLDRDLVLFSAVAGAGVLIALGAHTPFYRFLCQTFGSVFRAIRAPSRGIVLFDLALGVLAASGLAAMLRARPLRVRILATGAAVAVLVLEYRAFPLPLEPVPSEAPPVYAWLSTLDLPGAVVEWPLGLVYDFDYVFRQAQHQKPLINGYSGFFPPSYLALETTLKERPIPDSVWAQMGKLGASLLVYHAHEGRGVDTPAYADALGRVLRAGSVELVRTFPHGDGHDFVFIAANSPLRDLVKTGGDSSSLERPYAEATERLRNEIAQLAPPFGTIHLPADGQRVAPGFWVHGWAIDDSGIARIEVATDAGPAPDAWLGGPWPGLAEFLPDYAEAKTRGSFGFPLPALAPGPHRLVLTLVAHDGGRTRLERDIIVEPPPPSPTPRGPGS